MNKGPLAEVPVGDDERLARFVVEKRWLLKNGDGVNARALLPYSRVELSVTRHRDLSEIEITTAGEFVASERAAKENRQFELLGRADFQAHDARKEKLDANPDEPPHNHANIIGWPPEKSAQMAIAMELAARCTFVPAKKMSA